MKKYKYTQVILTDNIHTNTNILNDFGKMGWKLVCITCINNENGSYVVASLESELSADVELEPYYKESKRSSEVSYGPTQPGQLDIRAAVSLN